MGNCQKQEGEDELGNGNGTGPVTSVRISNYVWNKDYQGLFDYQNKNVDKKMVTIKSDAIIIKYGGKFELADNNVADLNEAQLKNALFRIVAKPNFYQIQPIYIEGDTYTLQKILWLVVASLPRKSHTIQEKDTLKLGKQKIRVRELVGHDNPAHADNQAIKLTKTLYENLQYRPPVPKSQLMVEEEPKENQSSITTSEVVCRICLEMGEYDNPLITPCKCSGSVKYIHLKCLKMWLGKRLVTHKSQHYITINWAPLSCEMCRSAYRYRVYLDNKKFYTVDIPKPAKPYITVQVLTKKASSSKVFYFISFAEKKKIVLGRKKDVDVMISPDISISRSHATLEYFPETKQVTISDNNSKFGTLVLVRKGIVVKPDFPGVSTQIGAEVYSFDALRGEPKPNFTPEVGDPDEYLLEHDSADEEDSQESENNESGEEDEEQEAELQEQQSPQLRQRPSMDSQQN